MQNLQNKMDQSMAAIDKAIASLKCLGELLAERNKQTQSMIDGYQLAAQHLGSARKGVSDMLDKEIAKT